MTPSPVMAVSFATLIDDVRDIDLRYTWSALRLLVADPTSNLPLALLVVAVVSLILLVLVMGLLLALAPRRTKVVKVRRYRVNPTLVEARKQGMFAGLLAGAIGVLPAPRPRPESQAPEQVDAKAPKGPRPLTRLELILTAPAAISVVVALALVGMYWTTSTDTYCGDTCHSGSKSVSAARSIDHASCVRCHERRGVGGIATNIASRGRMVVRYALGETESVSLPVASRSCVGCHSDIDGKVTVSRAGVRVSHREILAAGIPCVSCHRSSGHTRRAFTQGMSRCVTCHDGDRASAKCATCHTSNPANKAASAESSQGEGTGDMVYPLVNAARRECGGCHDLEKRCDPCHGGVRMPHSKAFINGAHAKDAAFERKAKCWRCHTAQGCNTKCHLSIEANEISGHPPTWKQDHAEAPRTAECTCHSNRTGRKTPMCPLCHGGSPR